MIRFHIVTPRNILIKAKNTVSRFLTIHLNGFNVIPLKKKCISENQNQNFVYKSNTPSYSKPLVTHTNKTYDLLTIG